MLKVAINGFGRIGRNAFKVALEYHKDQLEIVGINDLTEPKVLAHLLKYDSAYGSWDHDISSDEKNLIIDGKTYPIFAEKEPAKLPWGSLGVDVVIESTGRFTDAEGMKQHISAGAKRVVLSAPAKGEGVGTFLIGVNHSSYKGEEAINNASCTSNCIAPVIAVLEEKFGIAKGLYTTVHSVTAEQNLVDGPPPGGKSGDLRRARAAYANMIPTTTGAAIAVTQAITQLKGLLDGRAIRVPTITGSITDFTVVLKKKTTVEEVNQAFKDAASSPRWQGVLAATEEPIVSSDIVGRSESSIVDLPLTQVVDGDLVKVFAWYDNEWGYSNRLVEQVINVGNSVSPVTQPVKPPETTTPVPVISEKDSSSAESPSTSDNPSHSVFSPENTVTENVPSLTEHQPSVPAEEEVKTEVDHVEETQSPTVVHAHSVPSWEPPKDESIIVGPTNDEHNVHEVGADHIKMYDVEPQSNTAESSAESSNPIGSDNTVATGDQPALTDNQSPVEQSDTSSPNEEKKEEHKSFW